MEAMGRAGRRPLAAAGVAVVHLAIGYALLLGLTVRFAAGEDAPRLRLFAIDPPPAAKPEPIPAEEAAPEEEGEASPENLRAEPTPVVAPPANLPIVSPVVAAPIAGEGADGSAGAGERPGPGFGAGGQGIGRGAGGAGAGRGGGVVVRARLVEGEIVASDYPRRASRARIEGSVTARFIVGTDGRPRGCAIQQSSGNAELDATTCRLIEARFRYAPARDAMGAPVAEERGWRQDWWLERR